MTALVLGVLASSLVGSLHCAAMCGPLVALYAGLPGADAAPKRRALAHAAFSMGRLVAYVVLGAFAGAIGSAIDVAADRVGVVRAAQLVAGVLVTLWGIHALLAASGVRVRRIEAPRFAARVLAYAMQRVVAAPPMMRAGILGGGAALLPCGWLYAFVATAAGTGNALTGALVMAVFWLGTLPLLIALGEGVRALSGPLRRRLPVISAAAIIVLGLLTVGHRVQSPSLATTPACHASR